jgi:hypothetical protein
MFIILKSHVPDLVAHVKLIKEFTSEYVQFKCALGNTLSLIDTALRAIFFLDKDRLLEKDYLINVKIMENDLNFPGMDMMLDREGEDNSRQVSIAQQRNNEVMQSIFIAAQS